MRELSLGGLFSLHTWPLEKVIPEWLQEVVVAVLLFASCQRQTGQHWPKGTTGWAQFTGGHSKGVQ